MNGGANPYLNAFGTWIVTTEGDCEGRSTRNLGIYTGYLDEIAFFLANKCYYSLQFKAVDLSQNKFPPTADKVSVSLDIDSKTWDMNPRLQTEFFRNMLVGRDVKVQEGQYYASVVLTRRVSHEEKARETALAKLTPEEKRLLGLSNVVESAGGG